MLTVYLSSLLYGDNLIQISKGAVIASVCVTFALLIVLYVLRSVGVYALTSKAQIKQCKLSFVPFLWLYPFIMLVKEEKFFFKPFKKVAVFLVIIFFIDKALALASLVIVYYPVVGYYFSGGEVYLFKAPGGLEAYIEDFIYLGNNFVLPYTNPNLINNVLIGLYRVGDILDVVMTITLLSIYFPVFRKYWPQHYILASVFSLGLFPFFIFAIRNRKPINFQEYMREKYGAYGTYGNFNGQNNNGNNVDPFENNGENKESYNGNNGYNSKEYEDPFPEFSDKKDGEDKN